MFADAEIHYSTTFKPVEFFVAVAVWYLVLTTIWGVSRHRSSASSRVSDRGDELTFGSALIEAWTR